jgi:hypothetical protein
MNVHGPERSASWQLTDATAFAAVVRPCQNAGGAPGAVGGQMAELTVGNLLLRMDFNSANTLLALLLNSSGQIATPLHLKQDIASYGPLSCETARERRYLQEVGGS